MKQEKRTVNKKEMKKWIKALRSGDYDQTKKCLQDEKGYCCLGVACEVLIPKSKQQKYSSSDFLQGLSPFNQIHSPRWLKYISVEIAKLYGVSLMNLNDKHNYTFNDIADLLEFFTNNDLLEMDIMKKNIL